MTQVIKMTDFDINKLIFHPVKDKTAKGSSIKYKSISFGYGRVEGAPIVRIPYRMFCFGVQPKMAGPNDKKGSGGSGGSGGFSVCFVVPETEEGAELEKFINGIHAAVRDHLKKIFKSDKPKKIKKSPKADKTGTDGKAGGSDDESDEFGEDIFPSPLYVGDKDTKRSTKIYANLICFPTSDKYQPSKKPTLDDPEQSDEDRYDCKTILKIVKKYGPNGEALETKDIKALSKDAKGHYRMMPSFQLRGLFINNNIKTIRLQIDLHHGIIFPQSSNVDLLMEETLREEAEKMKKGKITIESSTNEGAKSDGGVKKGAKSDQNPDGVEDDIDDL